MFHVYGRDATWFIQKMQFHIVLIKLVFGVLICKQMITFCGYLKLKTTVGFIDLAACGSSLAQRTQKSKGCLMILGISFPNDATIPDNWRLVKYLQAWKLSSQIHMGYHITWNWAVTHLWERCVFLSVKWSIHHKDREKMFSSKHLMRTDDDHNHESWWWQWWWWWWWWWSCKT